MNDPFSPLRDPGANAPPAPPSPFHGVLPPRYEVQRERSVHRLAAYLFCTGLSQKAIADKLSLAPATVSNWWRQDWFQNFVKEEMAACGRDPIQEIIKGAAADSVFTLIEMRDSPATPDSVRRQCCSELLDRAFGKAPQTVHTIGYEGDIKDIKRIDDDLKSMLGDRALMQSLEPSMS